MYNPKPESIDEYISFFSEDIKILLESIRQTIRKAAPEAVETISYQMPAFKQNGILVYFAACKDHIGFYPTASGVEVFKKDLSMYKFSKGSIQFPLDKKLPLGLISKIVKYRVKENLTKKKGKV